MNEALFQASNEKVSSDSTKFMVGVTGFIQFPQTEITLTQENARIISKTASRLGIKSDELVNRIISLDIATSKKFHELSQELKQLLE